MPIVERDPWRQQYFDNVSCPSGLDIPTEDGDAYVWYPQHHWVYNKLMICETQGFEHGPHGLAPQHFPVFSKPIYNMRGMGAGSAIFRSYSDYQRRQKPGHLWMPMLEGEHVSTDVAVVNGEAKWWRHVIGAPLEGGMFDYWTVLAEPRPAVESYCADWLEKNMADYTGMFNFETIGGKIIEAHLRFSDQWPDLYGSGWVAAVIDLYANRQWRFDDGQRRTGYSVVLFGAHDLHYRHPPQEAVDEVLAMDGVSSVQITFHEDRPPSSHSMPPGGFRLAIVNCWDLEVGMRARERLALQFWSTQSIASPKRRRKPTPAA